MTNRDFYTAILNANVEDELKAFAQEALQKLDHTNELRRAHMAEKNAEKEAARGPIREAILECVTAEPKTATRLAWRLSRRRFRLFCAGLLRMARLRRFL